MLHIKLAQFAVRCALPPRRLESPGCATDNKPSCVLHLLGWFIGSRGFSSLEGRPEFWVLQAVSYLISPDEAFFISVITILTFSISFWFFFRISISLLYSYSCMRSTLSIGAGVPNPLIGTRPHSRRWTVGKASSLFTPLSMAPIITWAPLPFRSVAGLDSHRYTYPTVNCTCKGPRLSAPFENLMPNDLKWSWGADANARE